MNRRLIIGYRLHKVSRFIQYLPIVGTPLALRIRKLNVCRDYLMWSWGDY